MHDLSEDGRLVHERPESLSNDSSGSSPTETLLQLLGVALGGHMEKIGQMSRTLRLEVKRSSKIHISSK